MPKSDALPAADLCLEARLIDTMLMQDVSLHEAARMLMSAGEKKNAVYAASLRLKKMLKEE